MATQEYIDDLIIVIETAEDAESVTNPNGGGGSWLLERTPETGFPG